MKKQLPIINDREQTKRQHITDLILTNIEDFRDEASKVYGAFSLKERSLLEGLDANGIDSYNVLSAWEEELLPLIHALQSKQTEDVFRKAIVKNLFLSEAEIQPKIDELISKREAEIIHNFTFRLYPVNENKRKDIYKKQRERVRILFSRPEAEILQIKDHKIDYMLCSEAAEKNNIIVVDPYSSRSKRNKAIKMINKERRNILAAENERLEYTKGRLEALSAMNGGILIDITTKKWDLMTILSLRNQYEKSVDKLSKEDSNNAIKRLEIFDKETRDFRNEQMAKLVVSADQVSLAIARTITKDIDTLLLQVFDLTVIQKNQLVLNAKEYRELSHEQAEITKHQSNRLKTAR